MTDTEIDPIDREVDMAPCRADTKVDIRMGFRKIAAERQSHLLAKFGDIVTVRTLSRRDRERASDPAQPLERFADER